MSLLKYIREGMLHLLFPRLCEGCRKPLLYEERMLCLSCMQHLPRTGYHHLTSNDTTLRIAGRFRFRHATSLAYFTKDGLLQHLLHRLKYRNRQSNGTHLGELLGYELKQQEWAGELQAVIPVPLHPRKEAARGYNQSLLIAEGIAAVLGIPCMRDVLLRTRATESQTHKNRQERIDNVSGAFRVVRRDRISGKHLLLVDDVLTTGATLESCASALLAQGCDVSIATIGIAAD